MAEDLLSSLTNPNGIIESLEANEFNEDVGIEKKLILAAADNYSFLVNVADIDPDMAGVVTARCVRETLAAADIEIEPAELDQILEAGFKIADNYSVDRAIEMIREEVSEQ